MDVAERTVKGFIGLGTAKLLKQGLTWTLSIAIARLLSPADYGLMALGVFFVNFFAFVSEFGLSSSLIQKQHLDDDEVDTSFWVMLLANIGISLAIVFAAGGIANYYNSPSLAPVLRALSVNFIISSVRLIPMCLLTRELHFERCAMAEVISSIISSATMFTLAWNGYGVWTLVIGSIVDNAATAALLLWYRPWRPRLTFRVSRIGGMLKYGLAINGSKILSYLSGNADNLIVGKVLGGSALGLYNMAFVLGTMPTQKIAPIIHHISFPVLSRLQDDRERSQQYFLGASRYLAVCAAPAMFGLLILAHDFVTVVLGPKWIAMVVPLQMMCAAGVLKGLSVTIGLVLSARNRATSLLVYSAVETLVLSLAFYGGTRWGIEGVAAAWLVAYPLIFGYQLLQVLKELRIDIRTYLWNLRTAAAGTLVMSAAMIVGRGVVHEPLWRLVVVGAIGAASYAIVAGSDSELRDRLRGVAGHLLKRRSPTSAVRSPAPSVDLAGNSEI